MKRVLHPIMTATEIEKIGILAIDGGVHTMMETDIKTVWYILSLLSQCERNSRKTRMRQLVYSCAVFDNVS